VPARNVIPKPVQKPHPPMWVAASRPDTFVQADRVPYEKIMRSIELFGEKVIPVFRGKE
jgi:hypothetical protein